MTVIECDVCGERIRHIGYFEGVSRDIEGNICDNDVHICDHCYGKLCDLIADMRGDV